MDASLYARNTDVADFGDKILTLLDDQQLRTAMGEYGQRRAQDKLAWKHEAPRLIEAYDRLFSGALFQASVGQTYRNGSIP
jgi:glycosyltransferase involved in cell wall biosynthesis